MFSFFVLPLTIFWTLILLSVLIVIHELGHFLAAKFLGVHVEEFAVGFPPRIKKLFTWWDTPFVLNSIPIGGYVRLFGDDSETIEQLNEVQQTDGVTDAQAFRFKPIWARLIILLAGVFVNFLFAILCFSLLYSSTGIPEIQNNTVYIAGVEQNSPAGNAELQVGDQLIGFGETAESVQPVTDVTSFIEGIREIPSDTLFVTLDRSGDQMIEELSLRPAGTAGRMGVQLSPGVDYVFYEWWQMPIRGTIVGLQDSLRMTQLILTSLGNMLGGIFTKGTVPTDLKGPIGIFEETYKSGILQDGWQGSVNWLGIISLNLAIMNLLPIPVLDGGRSIFLLLEPILGRERRLRWEMRANAGGMMFLLGLFVVVSLSDVWGLFR